MIFEFNPAGIRSIFASGLTEPTGLAFNPAGDLFEVDTGSGHIYKFTPSGARSVFASSVQPCCGLAFDSSGDLFESVPDTSGSIEEYTPDGVKRTFFSGFISLGIAISPAAVPEPGTWALVLLGIVAFGIRERQLGGRNSRDLVLARHRE